MLSSEIQEGSMFSKADLHIHSTASDGELSPREIVILAKNRGIDTIAIADHNSVSSIDEASEVGKRHGVSVIPAVELSTRFNGESIHILGYFRDTTYNNADFQQILALVKTHKAFEARKILGGLRSKNNLANYLSTSEGILFLRTFGAAVVLAHPIRITSKNLPELLTLPFDGIEAKYCHSSDYYTLYFIKTALERFSFYTAGSDFHTNRISDCKHCIIGEPCLNPIEIQRFLKNSGALVLGANANDKIFSVLNAYY